MALDVQDIKATILAALRQYKGDDIAVARRSVRVLTDAELDLPYRSNGETSRDILERLEAHEEAVDKAIFYVESEL